MTPKARIFCFVYGQALWAYCWGLAASGRTEEAIPYADRALELGGDEVNQCMALAMRSVAHTFSAQHELAIRDIERATAFADVLGPTGMCGILMLQAQAHLFAGDRERAAELQAEAERVGEAVDAEFMWRRHTVSADTALFAGRPGEALQHYARSLEEAEARDNEIQILFDVIGTAGALAAVGDDAAALEVAGVADRMIAELGGREASLVYHLGYANVTEAERRLGPGAAEAKAQGAAVPAAGRVARVVQLARARSAAP